MKIRSKTMLGTAHSWAVTMRNLLKEFDKNHELYLSSINGVQFLDQSLLKNIREANTQQDIDIAYTAPLHFNKRFLTDSKLKLAIYNYETDVLPKEWLNSYKYIDFVLPSSSYAKDIFLKNGWPDERCIVIPHGVDKNIFRNKNKFKLKTDKKFKLLNISSNHYRKNIELLLDCYYELFNKDHDICLVIKTNLPDKTRALYRFEYNIIDLIKAVQQKYINKKDSLPAVEIICSQVDSLVELYNACDATISVSSGECFGLTMLESMAAQKLTIAPNCTGQLDFMNNNNSILIDSKQTTATEKYQYWAISEKATMFIPEKESVKNILNNVYKNYDKLTLEKTNNMQDTVNIFSWENAANKILEIKK